MTGTEALISEVILSLGARVFMNFYWSHAIAIHKLSNLLRYFLINEVIADLFYLLSVSTSLLLGMVKNLRI